jgi:hypothetical protein
MQKTLPTQAEADKFLDDWLEARWATTDANDLLYAVDASRNYDPSPALQKIKASVLAITRMCIFQTAVKPPCKASLGLIPTAMLQSFRPQRINFNLWTSGIHKTCASARNSWPSARLAVERVWTDFEPYRKKHDRP